MKSTILTVEELKPLFESCFDSSLIDKRHGYFYAHMIKWVKSLETLKLLVLAVKKNFFKLSLDVGLTVLSITLIIYSGKPSQCKQSSIYYILLLVTEIQRL